MKYIKNPITGENETITDGNGKFIPIDEANTDYQELMRQVEEEGLVIQPYVDPV